MYRPAQSPLPFPTPQEVVSRLWTSGCLSPHGLSRPEPLRHWRRPSSVRRRQPYLADRTAPCQNSQHSSRRGPMSAPVATAAAAAAEGAGVVSAAGPIGTAARHAHSCQLPGRLTQTLRQPTPAANTWLTSLRPPPNRPGRHPLQSPSGARPGTPARRPDKMTRATAGGITARSTGMFHQPMW